MPLKNNIKSLYNDYTRPNLNKRPTRIKFDKFTEVISERLKNNKKFNLSKQTIKVDISKNNIFNIISNYDKRYDEMLKIIPRDHFVTIDSFVSYKKNNPNLSYDIFCNITNFLQYASNDKDTIKIEIKNNVKDFLKIGEYGVDNHSCFRIGHQNESHKLNIIKNNNSFIMFFKDSRGTLLARCLGQFLKNGVIVSNFYHSMTFKYGSLLKFITNYYCRCFFENYFKKELIRTYTRPRSYLPRVYKNGDEKQYIFKK